MRSHAATRGGRHRVWSRVLLTVVVLVSESLAVGSFPHPWFHPQQIMAAPIAAAAAFLLIAWHHREIDGAERPPVKWVFIWLHGGALMALGVATCMLLRSSDDLAALSSWKLLWYFSLTALVLSLIAAVIPLRQLKALFVRMRWDWLIVISTLAGVMIARTTMRLLWNAPESRVGKVLQEATFASVKALLHVFYVKVVTRPGTVLLGTPKFHVLIAGECSGIEGMALVLLFTVAWLLLTRHELRLKRAIMLLPAALLLSWILNAVRIAALIALGNAGHVEEAINGFHSEAGWILFNVVGIAFLFTVQQVDWLRRDGLPKNGRSHSRNTASPYLLPFLAVLATGMLTHAVSSGFDWLYPLRLVVATGVLLCFLSDYRKLDWHFGWLGPMVGIFIFGVWLANDRMQTGSVSILAGDLLALPVWQRELWIIARALAAMITVPIAEELAFRGYLARRIVCQDVETTPFASLTGLSVAGSSIAFGLMHGRMWMAGIVSGMMLALVAKWRNRLGEAVAAHATANILIAVWVVSRGDYRLW